MAAKKKVSRSEPVTLHHVIGAASFWGTSTRVLLVTFLALFSASLSAVIIAGTTQFSLIELLFQVTQFTLVVAIITLAFDGFYVATSKLLPLRLHIDSAVVCLGDIAIASIFLLPFFVTMMQLTTTVVVWVVLALVLVVSIRAILGLLSGERE